MPFLSVSLWTECTQVVGISRKLNLPQDSLARLQLLPILVCSLETVGVSLTNSMRQPKVPPLAVAPKLLPSSGPLGIGPQSIP